MSKEQMMSKQLANVATPMGRRQMLKTLGLAAGAAYVAPTMLQFGQVRASGGSFSGGGSSGPSGGSSGRSTTSNSGGSYSAASPFRAGSGPSRPRRVVRRRRVRPPAFLRRLFNFS